MEHMNIDGASIEYQVHGDGEPVLLIPPGATIDGLAIPLFAQPEIASRFMLIHYHRRGYMGSTLGSQPLTITQQARDVLALLKNLNVNTAHIAGHSIGGAIALQLAIDAPERVHSLALLEPSLPMSPNGKALFEQRLSPIMAAYRSGNRRQAMEMFGDSIFGRDWQSYVKRTVPGGAEQAFNDVDIFFREVATIRDWEFGPAQAARIHTSVLSMVGLNSSPFAIESRKLLHAWFPQTEDFDPPTTHLLQMQDPISVAHGLAKFFTRHPII